MTAVAGRIDTGGIAGRERAGLVKAWLYTIAVLVAAMVVVGGATRLTHSGLSITEWRPIHGVIPPLTSEEWAEEFAKYRQIPEYQAIHADMTVEGFKGIFWWEWSHRLLGRIIGFVVLLPLIALWATGRIEKRLVPQILLMVGLGGLQGAVGWWMVASGLQERTDVSQYRLATHLVLACLILAYVLWVARGLSPAHAVRAAATRHRASWLIGLVMLQIYFGALVAGLDAGLVFNTWPLMGTGLVPGEVLAHSPWWLNFFENAATVQFCHRSIAYTVFVVAIVHAVATARSEGRGGLAAGAALLALAVSAQAILGIATLLLAVPLPVALAHQFGAVVVLAIAVLHRRAMAGAAEPAARPLQRFA
ncbi:MAG: COX15/CtaA family protein [Bauldia sp.]